MYHFPIGIIVDSFNTDTASAIKKCAEIGADGIQMFATRGANAPENLNTSARKELLDIVKSNGICFSALCGDLGHGFDNKERNPEVIEKSKRILDLAKDLETNIVTTHIGVVPNDPSNDKYKIMQDACHELAEYADSIDAHFAIETGPETSAVLKAFLDSLGSKGVAVNLDPANLVMAAHDDAVVAVHNLKDYIVHTHAKDCGRIDYGNRIITPDMHTHNEVPLGTGDVPFPQYLKALDEVGYRGFLTIEREVVDPEKDIRTAYEYLRKIIYSY